MEQQTNFTCRVDAELKQAFLRAAKASDRPASVLIRDFMRNYVQQSLHEERATLPGKGKRIDEDGTTC